MQMIKQGQGVEEVVSQLIASNLKFNNKPVAAARTMSRSSSKASTGSNRISLEKKLEEEIEKQT